MKRAALILALLAVPVAAPLAAMDAPARAELLPGWRTDDGRHVAAVRVVLDPGWKTYWRAPGDAGIPPTFEWRASNLAAWAVHFPVPDVIEQGGLASVGYRQEVVLPVVLTPVDPAAPIAGRVTLALGVCETVCVPLDVTLDLALPAAGGPDARIAGALADRPATAAEGGVTGVACRIDPIADGLRLTAEIAVPPSGERWVAVETGDPTAWVSEAKVTRSGGTLTAVADIVPSGAGFLLDRSALRFTILGDGRAVEVRGCG